MSAETTPAVERVAEAQFRAYESEYSTDGMTVADFYATARADLAVALDVEEMAAVLVEHAPSMWSSGDIECRCGTWKTKRDGDDWERPTHEYRSDAFRAHAAHLATAQRTAILGTTP